MYIKYLAQKLGFVALAGLAVSTLSSCFYYNYYYASGPKAGETMKYHDCNYGFYTIDDKKKTRTYASTYDKLIFKTGQQIRTFNSCKSKVEKQNATNSPKSIVLYVIETGDGRITRRPPRGVNKPTKDGVITYNKAGTYKQKHYVLTSDGEEFAVKYFTVIIVGEE